jgi:phosphoglycerate dehydrogenase-like enzyme
VAIRVALDERFRDVADGRLNGCEIAFYTSGIPTGAFADRDRFLAQVGNPTALGCGGGGPWPFDERVLEALPNLKFIHKIGAGTNWFDVEALTKRSILLANNAGLNAMSVADHLVMLMLICLRGAFDPMTRLRHGEWMWVPPDGIVELEDATVGIIGFGNVGSQVARRALGFGDVKVLAHQRRPLDPAIAPLGVRQAGLDVLLQQSDVVVLCVPLTKETDTLIGARELAMMKRGSILINGSRGRVVDERALCDALTSGNLRAAASDVFEEEPVRPDNPLLRLPNFIGTPHMAGRSRRNSPRQLEEALLNINRFLAGERPLRLVNPEVLDNDRVRL